MLDEILRGRPGKNGKNGKDGKDGKDGRNGVNGVNGVNGINGINAYPPPEMEYIRISTSSQTFTHNVKNVLPNLTNDFFTINGNVITFNKTGDYDIHYHVLGCHPDYSFDRAVVYMIRNNDGFILDDGGTVALQNRKYLKMHFSKDEAIYFKIMYLDTALDPIVGTVNINIKKV